MMDPFKTTISYAFMDMNVFIIRSNNIIFYLRHREKHYATDVIELNYLCNFCIIIVLRWNMDVMKGVRKMYKKLELILSTPQPLYTEPSDTWDVKHYKKIPVTGIPFKTRSKQKPETKTSHTPFFFKTLDQTVEEKDPNNNTPPCTVCNHPNKVQLI